MTDLIKILDLFKLYSEEDNGPLKKLWRSYLEMESSKKKSLSRQIYCCCLFSCCKILKFSIFLLAYPVFLEMVRSTSQSYQENVLPINRMKTQLSRDSALLTSKLAFFFCSN